MCLINQVIGNEKQKLRSHFLQRTVMLNLTTFSKTYFSECTILKIQRKKPNLTTGSISELHLDHFTRRPLNHQLQSNVKMKQT